MQGQVRKSSDHLEFEQGTGQTAPESDQLHECSERVAKLEREFQHLRQLLRRLAEPRESPTVQLRG